MKREREEEEEEEDLGMIFFRLDECVDILCLPVPSPCLVAKLLQLSKRIRSLVWRFLIEPNKGSFAWVENFCQSLWQLGRKSSLSIPADFTGYPVFVSPFVAAIEQGEEEDPETYFVGQKIERTHGYYLIADLYMSEKPHKIYKKYMARDLCRNIPKDRVINWFFVARALNIRFDKMILLHNETLLKTGGFIYKDDKHLFITQ